MIDGKRDDISAPSDVNRPGFDGDSGFPGRFRFCLAGNSREGVGLPR